MNTHHLRGESREPSTSLSSTSNRPNRLRVVRSQAFDNSLLNVVEKKTCDHITPGLFGSSGNCSLSWAQYAIPQYPTDNSSIGPMGRLSLDSEYVKESSTTTQTSLVGLVMPQLDRLRSDGTISRSSGGCGGGGGGFVHGQSLSTLPVCNDPFALVGTTWPINRLNSTAASPATETDSNGDFVLGVRLPVALANAPSSVRPPASVIRSHRPHRPSTLRKPRNSSPPLPLANIDSNDTHVNYLSSHEELGILLQTTMSIDPSPIISCSENEHIPTSPARSTPDLPPVTPFSVTTTLLPRLSRPKVAFIEPGVRAVETLSPTVGRLKQQRIISLYPPSPADSSSRSDQKPSPSAQFPGWGVITDDDDEEDIVGVDGARGGKKKNMKINDGDLTTDEKEELKLPVEDLIIPLSDTNLTHMKIPNNVGKQTTVSMKSTLQRTSRITTTTDAINNLSPALSSLTDSDLPPNSLRKSNAQNTIQSDKARFKIQQESLRQNPTGLQQPPSSSVSRLSTSVFRQPRKSLAMIFSNLSSNLGFSDQPPPASTIRRSASSPPHSVSSSDDVATVEGDRRVGGNGSLNPTDVTSSRLLRNKLGNSTLVHMGKMDSTTNIRDPVLPYMNGDVRRGRGFVGTSLSRTTSVGRGSEIVAGMPPAIDQIGAYSATAVGAVNEADRSLFVDLLCCTCCTEVDDEENYSTLIENHKLARFITLVTVLTILGLILVYIIRSAMETPQGLNPTTANTIGQQSLQPTDESSSSLFGNDRVERIRLSAGQRRFGVKHIDHTSTTEVTPSSLFRS